MVPHVLIAEKLQESVDSATPMNTPEPLPQVAVTAVPDESKGEKLIVVHTALPLEIEALLEAVGAGQLPKLWIPRRDAFIEVDEIPRLGSGKLDLQAVKAIAVERFGAPQP